MTLTGLTIPFFGLRKQYASLRNEILDATDEILRSGQLMNGNNTIEFENWLAKKNHSKYAVTCHSGTQALQIIAEFYRDDLLNQKVVLPSFTYPATINAFIAAGYDSSKILLADVDHHGILDVAKLDYSQVFGVVVVVGLYGASIKKHCEHLIANIIIEDAAQHWLADGCMRYGLATAISFDPTKNLPNYANGGAVVTNNLDLMEFARTWRSNGRPDHAVFGSNSRMSEVDCKQLLIKTQYLDKWQQRRKIIAKHWIDIFTDAGIKCLIDDSNFRSHGFQKFVIDIDHRNHIQEKLALRKIETKIHYEQSIFELPAYAYFNVGNPFLSNSASLSRRVLSLPFYPELTDLEVEYIADQVLRVCSKTI